MVSPDSKKLEAIVLECKDDLSALKSAKTKEFHDLCREEQALDLYLKARRRALTQVLLGKVQGVKGQKRVREAAH